MNIISEADKFVYQKHHPTLAGGETRPGRRVDVNVLVSMPSPARGSPVNGPDDQNGYCIGTIRVASSSGLY